MVKEFKTVLIPHISATKLKKDNVKEVAKEQRKYMNDNSASGSRKPHQRKRTRTVDCASQGIFKSGLASKPRSSYSPKRMRPLCINESNKGKEILNKVREDDEDESIELIPQPDEGKGLADELRADTEARSKMLPRRINEMDDRGKRILYESSDINSDSSYWSYDSYVETPKEFGSRMDIDSDDSSYWSYDYYVETPKEFGSRIKDLQNAKKLKSRDRDVLAPKSIKRKTRVGYLGNELFESGVIPRPECNYFVLKIKRKRMNELYIPMDLCKDENLPLPDIIHLVDPKGGIYPSELKIWKDERKFYKGGMGTICRMNGLTEDDYCICEFGEGDDDGFLFISIVRRVRS